MIPILAIVGSAEGRARSTVSVNLAVAASALGHAVELVDRDPAAPLARALGSDLGSVAEPIALEAGAGLGIAVRRSGEVRPSLRLVDAGPALDDAALDLMREAALVVVPLDATISARRALDWSVTALGGRRGALLVLLSRTLPRATDRWRLVDELDERYADALSGITVPMGRRGARSGPEREADATLYAPTGRAAKAYRAVAREILPRLGLAASRDRV